MATQTTVAGPAPQFLGYHTNLLDAAFNYANRPYQQYPGQRVAGLSDIQYDALSGIQNMMGNNPILGQAQGLYSRLMGGSPSQVQGKPGMPNVGTPVPKPGMNPQGLAPFASNRMVDGGMGGMGVPARNSSMMAAEQGGDLSPGNPFMSQMIGDVTNQATRAYQQATDSVNNRFTNPNSFGNSRHAMMQDQANEAFARGLGGALGQLQYGAYGEGLDRQMRAANAAQGLQGQQFSQLMQALQAGSIPQALRQRQMDEDYGAFRESRDYPWQIADRLSGLLSGTRSQQQTTQTPDPSRTSQLLGSAALLASLFGKPGGFSFLG